MLANIDFLKLNSQKEANTQTFNETDLIAFLHFVVLVDFKRSISSLFILHAHNLYWEMFCGEQNLFPGAVEANLIARWEISLCNIYSEQIGLLLVMRGILHLEI